MSDSLPPPPPPADLSAPPGVVHYTPERFDIRRLRRIGGLATAILVMLGVAVVGQLAQMATVGSAVDASKSYLDGSIGDDEWRDKLLPFLGSESLVGLASLTTGILSMIWLYRVAANHRALGRQVTFGPGWGIGGWFLPPFFWVIPALMTREHWKAAEPTSPPGSDTWRTSPEPWLVWIWFALFGPLSLIVRISTTIGMGGMQSDVEEAARSFADAGSSIYLVALVNVASAVAWALVVRGLTARHRRLTGEAA